MSDTWRPEYVFIIAKYMYNMLYPIFSALYNKGDGKSIIVDAVSVNEQ